MSSKKKPEGLEKRPNLHALGLQNIRSARRRWGVSLEQVSLLKALTEEFQLSVALGDFCLLYTSDRCRRYAVCRSRWSPYH